MDTSYSKISINEGSDVDKEAPIASKKLLLACELRDRYAALNPRQLLWTYDGVNAFSTENLPPRTAVRLRCPVFVCCGHRLSIKLYASAVALGLPSINSVLVQKY